MENGIVLEKHFSVPTGNVLPKQTRKKWTVLGPYLQKFVDMNADVNPNFAHVYVCIYMFYALAPFVQA
jgi:hypothetical protein